jgi:hypothetical protein
MKVFRVTFVHSVYNSALYLACCCCSFWLHVVANFVCIFLFSRQMFLLSTVPKFRHSCCGQTVSTQLFFWQISSRRMSIVIYPFLSFKVSLPYRRLRRDSALYTFIFENFWIKVGLKALFRIRNIWEKVASFVEHPFHVCMYVCMFVQRK